MKRINSLKKKNWYAAACLFAISMILMLTLITSGCTDTAEGRRASLTLSLEKEESVLETNSRSVLPETPLHVSYYTVTGIGPNDSIFNVSTQDSITTIPGLETGDWQITAYGWNENGFRLISGSTLYELTPDTNETSIVLDEYYGSGTVSVLITWDSSLTFTPEFHLYLYPQGGEETEISPTIAAGSASYETSLAAGSYILRCELFSYGISVAGCVEAVRIADGITSDGTIALNLDTMKSEISLSLTDITTVPVEGDITGIPVTVVSEVPIDLTFTPTNVAIEDLSTLTADWYLDGIYLQTGSTCTITPAAGPHRVDLLASTAVSGSSGSISKSFTATETGSTGALSIMEIMEDNIGDNQFDGIEWILVNDDDLIITASKVDDVIQTFRMESGSLVLKQTIENTVEIPLNGVKALASSDDGQLVCAISEYSKSLVVFSHTPGTNTLEFIEAFQTAFMIDGSPQSVGLISNIAIDSIGGNIYIDDRLEGCIFHFLFDGTEVVPIGRYTYVTSPTIDSPRKIAISPNGLRMAIPCYGSSSLLLFDIDPSIGTPSLDTIFSYSGSGTLGMGNANNAVFLTNTTLYMTSNDYLCEFRYGEPTPGAPDEWYQSQRIKEGTDVPTMDGPKHVVLNAAQNCIYVCASISNGITVFSRNVTTGILTYDSFISFEPGDPVLSAITSDGLYLLAPSYTSDQLFILSIAE
jgi:6-phosphogluconolactonase (cycloisomerase 2 family)